MPRKITTQNIELLHKEIHKTRWSSPYDENGRHS